MTVPADLEIGLHRWSASGYSVDLRFTFPESDGDVRVVLNEITFPIDSLRQLAYDPIGYGRALGEALFGISEIRSVFGRASASADLLRLRLFIGPNAQELHEIHWEALADPDAPGGEAQLTTGERVLFSRYVSSQDWRRVRLRAQSDLRALVVVANPSNLAAYRPGGVTLSPIDLDGELTRAERGLTPIPATILGRDEPASLANLVDRLHDGPDILYLACHGAIIDGEPRLWLQDETGQAAVTAGADLATRIRELERPPRLVVLASCQSAGSEASSLAVEGDPLTALGPRLGAAGVPAVLAMHGNVTMRTVASFLPKFFKELQSDGQIDRAVAVARGAVRDRPDAWAPVLFMRIKSGRIWYRPGFDRGETERYFESPAAGLVHAITRGEILPVVGWGLIEPLVGSRQEIAQQLTEAHRLPIEPTNRENLPYVLQHHYIKEKDHFVVSHDLKGTLRERMRERHGHSLGTEHQHARMEVELSALGHHRRLANAADPHKVLAELPVPIYITATPDSLLTDALRDFGKDPQIELFRWDDYRDWPPSVYEAEPDYQPDYRRPLVYHLCGSFNHEDSVVLTEGDYFDYLARFDANKFPAAVRTALLSTPMLYLGLQLDVWQDRAIFTRLRNWQEGVRSARLTNIIQLDYPEETGIDSEATRQFLTSYANRTSQAQVYWGSPEDFTRELRASMG